MCTVFGSLAVPLDPGCVRPAAGRVWAPIPARAATCCARRTRSRQDPRVNDVIMCSEAVRVRSPCPPGPRNRPQHFEREMKCPVVRPLPPPPAAAGVALSTTPISSVCAVQVDADGRVRARGGRLSRMLLAPDLSHRCRQVVSITADPIPAFEEALQSMAVLDPYEREPPVSRPRVSAFCVVAPRHVACVLCALRLRARCCDRSPSSGRGGLGVPPVRARCPRACLRAWHRRHDG